MVLGGIGRCERAAEFASERAPCAPCPPPHSDICPRTPFAQYLLKSRSEKKLGRLQHDQTRSIVASGHFFLEIPHEGHSNFRLVVSSQRI